MKNLAGNYTIEEATKIFGITEFPKPYYLVELLPIIDGIIEYKKTVQIDFYDGKYFVQGAIKVVTEYNGREYNLTAHNKAFGAYNVEFNTVTHKHNQIRNQAYKISHNLNKVKKGSLKKINAVLAEAEEQYLFAVAEVEKTVSLRKAFIEKMDSVTKELGLHKSDYNDLSYRAETWILNITISIDSDDNIRLKYNSDTKFKNYSGLELADEFIQVVRKLNSVK